MDKKCILCLRSDVIVHFYSKQYICDSCICVAYDMVNKPMIKPKNDVEEIIFSLVFFLENEIIFAQDTLNNIQDLQKCQILLKEKLKLIDKMNFSVEEINPILLESLVSLKLRYKRMIELFIIT